MIKQYFTDGLIQIAIILSLLRTDLNNLHFHHNYINYPEVQDIILGQSIAYAPTSFHNNYNTLNSLSGSVHPKHIDSDYNSAIFRDLRSLSRFRRFEGIETEVNAFLVSDTAIGNPATLSALQSQDHSSEDVNNNDAQSAIPDDSSTVALDNVVAQSTETVDKDEDSLGAVGLPPTVDLPGSEPTDEDLDLIEVLWRQDIDLGVGKEVFDVNLRRELERDRELELQKKREKQKELELLGQKAAEERRQQQQQWLNQNFMQDGETGEWVPLNNNVTTQQQPQQQVPHDNINNTHLLNEALLDILNAETNNFIDYTVPDTTDPLPLPPQPQLSPRVDNYMPDTYNTRPLQQGPSSSLDQQWDDLVSLLDLAELNNSQLNMTAAVAPSSHLAPPSAMPTPHLNYTNLGGATMMDDVNTTSSSLSTQHMQAPCINSSVLLQNATIPPPVANISTLGSPTTDMSTINNTEFLPSEFNSSVPNTDGISSLDWEASDMLFSNVTVNNTKTLLPDFLQEDDDELDIAIKEGLKTMQMLDDASSDSGSASPLQELTDSGSMSPYDGLEGATGGSDYGSPSYSKASKYDPGEYQFRYSSGSFSGSESSQTNHSTSSNDTNINKPLGGGTNNHHHHINHNHTYPQKPGSAPRELKTSVRSEKNRMKGPHARDQKRARELNVPFTMDQIIESPVEEFNEMVTKCKLTEPQIQLIRDIRRRGKNKVAAQNCRKRKLDVVVTLEDEMANLESMKDKLLRERQQIDQQTRDMKEKFSHVYQEIFRSLRDEHGHPYDPNEYSLQQSSDGNVFLVPRNVSADDKQMNGTKKRKNIKKE